MILPRPQDYVFNLSTSINNYILGLQSFADFRESAKDFKYYWISLQNGSFVDGLEAAIFLNKLGDCKGFELFDTLEQDLDSLMYEALLTIEYKSKSSYRKFLWSFIFLLLRESRQISKPKIYFPISTPEEPIDLYYLSVYHQYIVHLLLEGRTKTQIAKLLQTNRVTLNKEIKKICHLIKQHKMKSFQI